MVISECMMYTLQYNKHLNYILFIFFFFWFLILIFFSFYQYFLILSSEINNVNSCSPLIIGGHVINVYIFSFNLLYIKF